VHVWFEAEPMGERPRDWIATNLAKKNEEAYHRAMTQQPKKRRTTDKKPEIGEEFRRIAEKNLRRDRELLERLAKI
jgi:hypothetical protein